MGGAITQLRLRSNPIYINSEFEEMQLMGRFSNFMKPVVELIRENFLLQSHKN